MFAHFLFSALICVYLDQLMSASLGSFILSIVFAGQVYITCPNTLFNRRSDNGIETIGRERKKNKVVIHFVNLSNGREYLDFFAPR